MGSGTVELRFSLAVVVLPVIRSVEQAGQHLVDHAPELAELVPAGAAQLNLVDAHLLEDAEMLGALLW
jgi:hypothetical protein